MQKLGLFKAQVYVDNDDTTRTAVLCDGVCIDAPGHLYKALRLIGKLADELWDA